MFDDVAVPDNCEVTGIPVQPLVAGSKTIDITIITKNCDNERCSKGGSHVVEQTQSRRAVVTVEVKDSNDGSCV